MSRGCAVAAWLAALGAVAADYAAWARTLGDSKQDQVARAEIGAAVEAVTKVLASELATGVLPARDTANALRLAVNNGPSVPPEKARNDAERAAAAAKAGAAALLNPADNKGGLMSFRYVAPLSAVLAVVFGIMHLQDRRRRRAAAGT